MVLGALSAHLRLEPKLKMVLTLHLAPYHPPPTPKPSSREQGQTQTIVTFFLHCVLYFLDVVKILINVREIIYALQCEQIHK